MKQPIANPLQTLVRVALVLAIPLAYMGAAGESANETANAAQTRGGSCYWMESRPPYNWQSRSRYDLAACYDMDSCDGGRGHSGGGCYKWADCPTCERYPWPNANRPAPPDVTSSGSEQHVPDDGFYYRLSTQFRGDRQCLDVYNGGERNNMTHLVPCANFTGQFWRLSPAQNGRYRLTTAFRGVDICLDVYNGGARNNQVHLTECAKYSGQLWSLRAEGEWYRLTTDFRGDGQCLDIFNGGQLNNMPHLTDCANTTGQFWKLTRMNRRTQ